jgi:hypothetical protein
MSQTSNRPGAADSGPIRSQSLAGGGISAPSSLPAAADYASAYIAVMVDRFETPRRTPYLNPHHATQAVPRAQTQGRQAWLILCKLEPVQAVLDIDGEL